MTYYIGIDGGGSKTRFACFDETGVLLKEYVSGGSYCRQLGVAAVEAVLLDGIKRVRDGLYGELAAVSFGMPGFGESPEEEERLLSSLRRDLAPVPFFVANDVAMAFHGAFAGNSGIMLVAGTGSMAWGRDENGEERRCGGWSECFGDEGSGYWVGRKAIGLFSKESDGRKPKTLFYDLLKAYLNCADEENDLALVSRLEALFESRAQVAKVHRVLLEAAEQGDREALEIYAHAAEELASIVIAMRRGMAFGGNVPVSYVGGMFNCERLILDPVKKLIEASFDASINPPMLGPCQGAALFAAARLGDPRAFENLRAGMLGEERKNV